MAAVIPSPPLPRRIGPLTRTDFVKYQGASGDFQPIHHDEVFATASGYPSVFSVGMLQAGALACWATAWLGADNVRRYRVRFQEQVWPGDTLSLSGTVAGERVDDVTGEALVDVDLVCTRQTGGVAIRGWATFAIPS